MAARKPSARSGKQKAATADATDASLIPESTSEQVDTAADTDAPDQVAQADAQEMVEDAVIVPDEPETEETTTDEAPDNAPTQAELAEDMPAKPAGQQPTPRVVERRSGVLPLVFGGVLTAGLGFLAGAADLLGLQGDSGAAEQAELMAALDDRIGDLESGLQAVGDRITALPQPDLSPALSRIDAAEAALAGLQSGQGDLSNQITALGARVTELATLPVTEGASEAAVAAFEAELAALQASIAEQRAQVEQMVADARALEADAAEQARLAELQAAMARLTAAIDSGDSLAAEIAALAGLGVEVPQGLIAATDGAPTLASLRDGFPPAARDALAAARSGGEGDGGVTGWLQKQLGARSVTPRDGADADAVLSRAEAAVTAGRVGDALTELDTLPDAARDTMSAWIEAARMRVAATDAADALAAQLATK